MSDPPGPVRDIIEAPPLHGTARQVGRRVIAVIGIDRYVHWPRLRNAVNDARRIEQTFIELGFEVIVPSLFDGDATHAAIDDLFDALGRHLTNQDHLVLFFAGHGGTTTRHAGNEPITTGYLIPVDGTLIDDRPASLFELGSLLSRISRLAALHILVILDACHSGSAFRAAAMFHRARGGSAHDPNVRIHAKTSRVVIASTLSDEVAQDGGPLPGHSLFTACLIHALERDMPRIDLGDGRCGVHGSSLGAFVRDNIYRHQPEVHRQTPDFGRFGNDDRGDMPIVLARAVADSVAPAMFAHGSAPTLRASKIDPELALAFEPAFASQLDIPILSAEEQLVPSASRARPIAIGVVSAMLAAVCSLAWWWPSPPTLAPAAIDDGELDTATAELAPDRVTRANDPPPAPPPLRSVRPHPASVIRAVVSAPIHAAVAKCYADVMSIPKGADVFRGDAKLGTTPLRLELPCGLETTLMFQKAEHNPMVKKFVATPEGVRVSTRLPRTAPRVPAQ